jgi:hypothetical protein
MIKNGFLCMPVVDENEEPIFIPNGFELSEIETDRTSYLIFRRSSERVWETLTMSFYTDHFKVIVYWIEYTREVAHEDYHSIYTQEFSTFSQLREFFRIELAKTG